MAEADDPGFSDSIVIELDLQEGGESSTGSVVGYGGEARKFGDHRSATSEVPLSPEPLSGITTYAPTELTRGGGEARQNLTGEWDESGSGSQKSGSVAFPLSNDSAPPLLEAQLGADRQA